VSHVYVVTCYVQIILHYRPSRCTGKQANILSHVTCSYCHHRLTSISTQGIYFSVCYLYTVSPVTCIWYYTIARRVVQVNRPTYSHMSCVHGLTSFNTHDNLSVICIHCHPSRGTGEQATILTYVTCSYCHATDSRLYPHRRYTFRLSYVHIVACHMHIILHNCPSRGTGKPYSHMSHAHTATPQTHVYVHTGDILEIVICIYCRLSHAYNTTILPVALDM